MTPVFADTHYYIALTNPVDRAHAKAVAFALSGARPIVTTAWVVTELADGFCKAPSRPVFLRLRALMLSDPNVEIVPAEQALMDRGLTLYEARLDKEWTLTDCISFIAMNDRGLTEALTADHHFEQAGFTALLK